MSALHNETAGSPGWHCSGAPCSGDLSHKVYWPVPEPRCQGGRKLLFLELVRKSAEGIGTFFSDPPRARNEEASKLFDGARRGRMDAARAARFGFDSQAPAARAERYLGVVRGPVDSAGERDRRLPQGASSPSSPTRGGGANFPTSSS